MLLNRRQGVVIMINLFNVNNYNIDTSHYSNFLHDKCVTEFENEFADYVGAKYACSANSASSLLFLSLMRYAPTVVKIPTMMPIVVPNVITNTNHKIVFYDDPNWVGHYYHLHDNIYDSAQEVSRNIYKNLNNDNAMMVFSFYPTKPVSSCDGGMVVSNDYDTIQYFKTMTMNGTTQSNDSWKRVQTTAGYKMHINSIQASIAQSNLKKLDTKNKILDEIKKAYNQVFGINNTSNHLYRIRVKYNALFVKQMADVGIQCGIHYDICHNKTFFNCDQQSLPLSEATSKQYVSIPFHEALSVDDIKKVVLYTQKFAKENVNE